MRKALGRERLLTRAGGYELVADGEEVDVRRFERLAEEGRAALAAGDAERAAALLRDALALWRGDALADFTYESFAQTEIGRLEERRLEALEDRIDGDLALGRRDVAELEALVAAHPLRERLRGQLMLALYRAGRQAEALQAYQDTRRALVEELGIEPGPALQRLERAILLQDPALELPVAPAPREEPEPETRRTVTAVVALARGAGDPEALPASLERVKDVLEGHGAVIVPSGADSVVGLFGVPRVREDDAVRAARAALEARDAEVGLALVTGDIVVAGGVPPAPPRPERLPEAGVVLCSARTARLLRGVAELEERDGAWLLVAVRADADVVPRRPDAPLVGREEELERMRRAFDRAIRDRSAGLVTLLGPAGIGKSRLATELVRSVGGRGRVLWARCPLHGEGATFLPLAELVRQAFGDEPEPAMAALAGAEVAARVAGAVGLGGRAAAGAETFWAVRRLLSELASERPLLVVLDDVQWAEPTLLDLVEQAAELVRDAPLLLACLARPELLDERPSWGGGKLEAESILLRPLSDDESAALIGHLAGDEGIDEADRAQIAAAAEGNPLFIEQMLAMRDEHGADLAMPPTIHALLSARLDRLGSRERELLQRASVIGREFSREALEHLSGPAAAERLSELLDALVRKDLVAPEFRFRHHLIRDAAYASLPKRTRAELHERLAAWLDGDETVGYHLEQAARYRTELGAPDDDLARRAGARLAAAGRRAYARGDLPTAAGLVGRAADLLQADDPARLELLPLLADIQRGLGRIEDATAAIDAAIGSGDERVVWHARVARLRLTLRMDAALRADEILAEADEAIAALDRLGDERGLAEAWAVRSWVSWLRCRADETADAVRRSIDHARRAGDESTEAGSTRVLLGTILFGPTPVEEGIRRCEQELVSERPLLVRATAFRALAGLTAMAGRFDDARSLLEEDAAILRDLGLTVVLAHAAEVGALVELLAGDPEAAESRLRAGLEVVAPMGEMAAPTFAAMLARALEAQGRDEEAVAATEDSERSAAADDLTTQVQWRGPRARVLARRGRAEEAERLAREAVALAERTDFLTLHGDALADLAVVLGDPEPAARALALYEAKGNVAAAARVTAAHGARRFT